MDKYSETERERQRERHTHTHEVCEAKQLKDPARWTVPLVVSAEGHFQHLYQATLLGVNKERERNERTSAQLVKF